MISLLEHSKEWLDHARDDLRVARYLMDAQPAPCEIICFHCQQAVEKALKGYLIFHDQEAPRTHDTELLCQMCGRLGDPFTLYEQGCVSLAKYAVAARYPNDMEIDLSETQTAINDAAAILEYVAGLISNA